LIYKAGVEMAFVELVTGQQVSLLRRITVWDAANENVVYFWYYGYSCWWLLDN